MYTRFPPDSHRCCSSLSSCHLTGMRIMGVENAQLIQCNQDLIRTTGLIPCSSSLDSSFHLKCGRTFVLNFFLALQLGLDHVPI